MPLPGIIARHKLASALLVIIAAPLITSTLWTLIALNFSYARGERAGVLQKISQRGWMCKTWEGELQLTATPGSAPEKFTFTIRSDSVAAELNKRAGERVVLSYDQHRGIPGSCFGDTEYFVTGIRLVGTP
ncbi:MAG: hypothetical protein ABJF01_00890 [bacterium]